MLLTTVCTEKGTWLGRVHEDAYSDDVSYLCFYPAGEVCLVSTYDVRSSTSVYFPSEEAVVDAFVTYNKEEEERARLKKELHAKSNEYVWDNGALRKI